MEPVAGEIEARQGGARSKGRGNDTSDTIERDSLQVLSLSMNNLSGIIPASLGSLSSLQALYLSSNKLQGAIPNTLRISFL